MDPLRAPRILWLGILVSTLLFVVVSVALPPPPLDAAVLPAMPLILGVLAASLAVVSFVLPARLLQQALRARPLPVTEEPDPAGGADYRAQQRTRKAIRVDADVLRSLLPAYQTALILSLALSEAISIFGLVLNRLGFAPWQSAPFFAVGTLLVVVRLPRQEAVLTAVERAQGVPAVDGAEPPGSGVVLEAW